MKTLTDWRFYYPDDGETAEDAAHPDVPDWTHIFDAEDVAQWAVEYDWSDRDGWECNRDREFPIAVIDKHGVETRWIGWNEPTVDHHVREAGHD